MGKLIDGKWVTSEEEARTSRAGDFVRGRTTFREWIAKGTAHPPEAGRYHLWVADNCPWAHRAIITRNLKGLRSIVGMSTAHYRRDEDGWWFPEGIEEVPATDGKLPLHVLYSMGGPDYTGSATVPILWDRRENAIVSNESADIIEILNASFNEAGATGPDLFPESLRGEIEEVNAWVYEKINNGVYKCGFARTQEAYERAFVPLFEALDEVEKRLARTRFLVGNAMTLADIRLFTTLVRFDAVYFGHFKCNLRRVVDYASLWPYMRDMFQTPGVGETVNIEVYKLGYYGRSPGINPRGLIPLGPDLDFEIPHGRAEQFS